MKNTKRNLLIAIIPLISPWNAFGETGKAADPLTPVAGTHVSAASWRASEVIGTNVKNAGNETIGNVEDLVVDMTKGEVIAVIISSGGFLGIADTLSAVPVSALRYDPAINGFKTNLTKEQLGKAPQFKTDAWPDYREATSTEKLRAFRDSISGDVSAPDNTAQNEKEMTRNSTTPTDQGNSVKDIQTTKDIRSGIIDTDLSFNAKNIKIVTRNESVTLKGVVDSIAEHQAILKIAGNHADKAKITDELKIKAN